MRQKLETLLLIMTATCFGSAWSADILYVSMTPSPSHHIWDRTLAMALRDRHHRITYVTHSPEKSVENFTTIIFEGVFEKLDENFSMIEYADVSPMDNVKLLFEWITHVAELDVKTEGFKKLNRLIEQKPHFDLIIFDMTVGQWLYPIIEKFNSPPVIATSQFGLAPYYTFHFGISPHTPYIPGYSLAYTDQMSFTERVTNYLFTMYFLFWRQYIYMPQIWNFAEEHFGKNITPYQTVEKNVSLLLANYDPVLDYPQPIPPAVIPVGGLHTKREKTLPKDLQKILDDAKDGVILFSLGTNIKPSQLGKKQKQALIDAFAQMKQTVLWKYDGEISGLPKNLIVRPWLPQNDILAHPNTRLFITHGGALSTQEAQFHGVPVVGVPFVADQHVNTRKMAVRRMGRKLDIQNLTKEAVLETVFEVINNPVYKENSKKISRWYRDQPTDPLTKAVWWVEYVIRQGGAHHLRIAPRDMSVIQLEFLDMWAALLAIVAVLYLVLKKIYRWYFGSSKHKREAKTPKEKLT